MELFESLKRKSGKSSGGSASSPEDKRSKVTAENSEFEESFGSELDQDKMAAEVAEKLDTILDKLNSIDSRMSTLDTKMDLFEKSVSDLQERVARIEGAAKIETKKVADMETGLNNLNSETELLRTALRLAQETAAKKNYELQQEILYHEVYSRRENLRLYGIPEAQNGKENTEEVLREFLQHKLGMEDANEIEFQRVHRIGNYRPDLQKPRQITARFLRYPDRESVFENVNRLAKTGMGVSADYPKAIVERRQVLLPLLKEAKK